MTTTAIERHIVWRLAELNGRDPNELELELRLASRELPVDVGQLGELLPVLERDYGVRLCGDHRIAPSLSYVHDLAVVLHKRVAAAASASRRAAQQRGERAAPAPRAQPQLERVS